METRFEHVNAALVTRANLLSQRYANLQYAFKVDKVFNAAVFLVGSVLGIAMLANDAVKIASVALVNTIYTVLSGVKMVAKAAIALLIIGTTLMPLSDFKELINKQINQADLGPQLKKLFGVILALMKTGSRQLANEIAEFTKAYGSELRDAINTLRTFRTK